jgi:hypothetical protein
MIYSLGERFGFGEREMAADLHGPARDRLAHHRLHQRLAIERERERLADVCTGERGETLRGPLVHRNQDRSAAADVGERTGVDYLLGREALAADCEGARFMLGVRGSGGQQEGERRKLRPHSVPPWRE